MIGAEQLDKAALTQFAEARSRYSIQDWQGALQGFKQVLSRYPDDGPSQVFIERCQALQQSPPAADWDGVWPPQ